MQVKVVINGVSHAEWLAEGGYVLTPLLRQARSVITIDGTDWRTQIEKHQLDLSYVELRDNTLATLKASLLTNPATVTFTDDEGNDLTRIMYITGPTVTAKTVKGGNTYYSGVSLTLEEK